MALLKSVQNGSDPASLIGFKGGFMRPRGTARIEQFGAGGKDLLDSLRQLPIQLSRGDGTRGINTLRGASRGKGGLELNNPCRGFKKLSARTLFLELVEESRLFPAQSSEMDCGFIAAPEFKDQKKDKAAGRNPLSQKKYPVAVKRFKRGAPGRVQVRRKGSIRPEPGR